MNAASMQPYKTGVYMIRNKLNGKVYIGSGSKNSGISGRLRTHKYQLRNGKHFNHHLQSAWNKYGEKAFEFSAILYCHPSECLANEQIYIDEYNACNSQYGYNISSIAGAGPGRPRNNQHLPIMRVEVGLTEEQIKLLRMWGKGNVSGGIRWLVEVTAPFIYKEGKYHILTDPEGNDANVLGEKR